MNDVTVVLLSLGEPFAERALESIQRQSLTPAAILRVEGVSPFTRAICEGARQVKTTYFLQLDSDMILDSNCLRTLRAKMGPDVACVVAHLRDPMVGRVVGVKLFRTQLMQDYPFPDSVSCDVDWLRAVQDRGWKWHLLSNTLGSHEPDYNPNYTFCKNLRWSSAYLNERDYAGIRSHLRQLLESQHPNRWLALLGFAEGMARPQSGDSLVRYPQHPKLAGLQARILPGWKRLDPPTCERAQEAFELGYTLGRAGQLVCWEGSLAWAGVLGVCLGVIDSCDGSSSPLQFPWHELPPERPSRRRMLHAPRSQLADWMRRWRFRLEKAFSEVIYPWWVDHVGPGRLPPPPGGDPPPELPPVGYYVWQLPCEVFVQREVDALKRKGLRVEVYAQEGHLRSCKAWTLFFLVTRPLLLLRCLRFLLGCRYQAQKDFELDCRLFRDVVRLAWHARQRRWGRIHSPWANPCALVALLAARLAGIACTVEVRAHELNRVESPPFLPALLPCMEAVVTNSDHNFKLLQLLLQSRVPLHKIYNGIDLADFPPFERDHRPCPDPFHILCVARLVDTKGLEVLLEACHGLRARGIPFRCTVVGGTEEPRYTYTLVKLRRLYKQLELQGLVEFRGDRPFSEVLQLYRDHHVFVLPARIADDGSHDVTPNSIFEAMALSMPIVSCPIGAIPEQIEHEDSGLLVESRNPALLLDALERLWRDGRLRQQLGQRARQRCQQLFSCERQAAQWLEFFSNPAAVGPEGAPTPQH